jgi:hypothetical protein
MSKTRNVVKNLTIETAVKERKCHADSKHKIAPGEMHLAHEVSTNVRENICLKCAGKILDLAQKHLATIRTQLGV